MADVNSITDIIKDLTQGNMLTQLSPALTTAWFFIKVFFYFTIFVFGCVLIYKFWFEYKVKITVKKRIGSRGGVEVVHDRAKIVVDAQGKHKLQFYKTRRGRKPITCPMPEANYKQKIGKADHFEFWLDDNYQVHPIIAVLEDIRSPIGLTTKFPFLKKIGGALDDTEGVTPVSPVEVPDDIKLKVIPQERNAWARYEDKAIQDRIKKVSAMEKYLPAGIVVMAMLIAFLIWFFAVKELGAGVSDMATKCLQSCTSLMS